MTSLSNDSDRECPCCGHYLCECSFTDGVCCWHTTQTTETLDVQLLVPGASPPLRATDGAAGYDVHSAERVVIEAGERGLVNTGFAIRVPEGTYGRIASRSSIATNSMVDVCAGVIDRDYIGSVKVLLHNHSNEAYTVLEGQRIAQLIIERIATPPVRIVQELSQTARGTGGFGSTGQ